MGRRTFLKAAGWAISGVITYIVIRVTALSKALLTSGNFSLIDLFDIKNWRRPTAGHNRAKFKRVARRAAPRFTPALSLFYQNLHTGVVHWPNSKLFVYRSSASETSDRLGRLLSDKDRFKTFEISAWKKIVQNVCSVRKNGRMPPVPHFEREREGRIREILALKAITVEKTNSVQLEGLDEAIAILSPVFLNELHRSNWRLYELFGRLACLRDPGHPDAAYRVALTAWGSRPSPIPDRLPWLKDDKTFMRWHEKTVDENSYVIKRLVKRVEFARSIVEGASSSGKDTALRGESRSNRLAMPSSKEQIQIRKNKLSRRRERRHNDPQHKGFLEGLRRTFRLPSGQQNPKDERRPEHHRRVFNVQPRNDGCLMRVAKRRQTAITRSR